MLRSIIFTGAGALFLVASAVILSAFGADWRATHPGQAETMWDALGDTRGLIGQALLIVGLPTFFYGVFGIIAVRAERRMRTVRELSAKAERLARR